MTLRFFVLALTSAVMVVGIASYLFISDSSLEREMVAIARMELTAVEEAVSGSVEMEIHRLRETSEAILGNSEWSDYVLLAESDGQRAKLALEAQIAVSAERVSVEGPEQIAAPQVELEHEERQTWILLRTPISAHGVQIGNLVVGSDLEKVVRPSLGDAKVTLSATRPEGEGWLPIELKRFPDQTVWLLPTSQLSQEVRRRITWDSLWLSVGIALLMGAVGVWLFQRLFLAGFERITRKVQELSDAVDRGKSCTIRFDRQGPRELDSLQKSVANLAKRIDGYRRRIELKTRTEVLGERLAQAAHDIRGPLGQLSKAVDVHTNPFYAPREKVVIHKLFESVLAVANSLVAQSVSDDEIPLTNVGEVAQTVVELADRHELEILVYRAVYIDGNRLDLERAIRNLLTNALDSLGENGRVQVRVDRTGNFAVVEVCDNGCGIAPEKIQEIREPGKTFGKPTGTGIGLWQVSAFVESRGGEFILESVPGIGTRAVLIIPCARLDVGSEGHL